MHRIYGALLMSKEFNKYKRRYNLESVEIPSMDYPVYFWR